MESISTREEVEQVIRKKKVATEESNIAEEQLVNSRYISFLPTKKLTQSPSFETTNIFFFNLFLCDSLDPFTRTMPPNTSNIAPVISPDECPSLTSERDSKMKDSGFVWSFSDEVSIFLHSGSLGRSSRELGEGDLTLKVL